MCAQTARLSDRQLKAVKPKDKDYVLTDGDGLQLRVRVNRSMQWNFNYRLRSPKIESTWRSAPTLRSLWRKLGEKRLRLGKYLRRGPTQKLSAMISRRPS